MKPGNSDGSDTSLEGHLSELRLRIIVSVAAILVTSSASFFLADWLLAVLLAPSGGLSLRAFGILDGFMIRLRLAVYAGVVGAFPVWAWQAARFVGPGLLPRERRRLIPFLGAAILLFAAGTILGYRLLGLTVEVLVKLFPPQVEYLPSATDYLSFAAFFLFACGVAFEVPVVLVLLVSFGIIGADALSRRRKIAWFLLFAFAEIVTPVADPIVAPMIVFVPLVLLFEASILVSRLVERRRARPGSRA